MFYPRMIFKKIKGIIIVTIAIIASCKKPDSYSDVPAITFKSIFVEKNQAGKDSTAHLIISFTDGDGDLGTEMNEGPNNFIVTPYRKEQGNWIIDTSLSVSSMSGHLPYLTQTGSNKALKGDVDHDIDLPLGFAHDTLQYQIYIVDRSLNHSNTIVTPEIIIDTE
jgi:hypothetical protein